MAPSTLSQLSKLIAESVAAIEASCATRGVEVPSIDSAFTPGSEALRMDPTVAEAINIATASAYQIAALLEPPPVSVSHIASGVRAYVFTTLLTLTSRYFEALQSDCS